MPSKSVNSYNYGPAFSSGRQSLLHYALGEFEGIHPLLYHNITATRLDGLFQKRFPKHAGHPEMKQDRDAYALASAIMKQFNDRPKRKTGELKHIDYWNLEGFESRNVIRILANPQEGWIPLHKMVGRLYNLGKYFFWRTVFENRDCIPHDELLKVWYSCYMDSEENSDFSIRFDSRPEWLFSVFAHPLMIDNWRVQKTFIESKLPGWRSLKCIRFAWKRKLTVKMSDAMVKAFDDDCGEMFEIVRTMECIKICLSKLLVILDWKKLSVLRQLVANGGIPKNVMTLEELCCFCTSQFPEDQAISLLNAIEEARPGTLRSAHDAFGRNLLWQTLFNKRCCWMNHNCGLTSFLLEKGCVPDNRNLLGLSWQEVVCNLPRT